MAKAALALVPETRFDDGADYDAELDRKAKDWLHSLPDEFLYCFRDHDYAKLRPRNGKLPRGVTAAPIDGLLGHFQITQRCKDCGTKRIFTCSGDLFAGGRRYDYDWPDGYNMPKGAARYVTWADIQRERNDRFAESFLSLAKAKAS